MSVLVFSERCKHCIEIIKYIQQHPELQTVVRFHNINKGVPNRVTRVPTLLTSDGKILVGGEVKAWLESMLPSSFSEYESSNMCMASLDNTDCDNRLFDLNQYGQSLKPNVSREIEERMNMTIEQAMAELKN
ncbi:hypothetical protein EBT31_06365 [bacterium]|nr:hypothetical protein [bacterium]NBX48942.1 hypothetical protein [bacterium]